MASRNERRELAKLCCVKDWSKAIRILDKILEESCSIQDICNRAFCYSQLELHKHVIKDCDRALQIDPNLLQPYILKGHALSALGRNEEGLLVWEQGYEKAAFHSADLKQFLELEELLSSARHTTPHCSEPVVDPIQSSSELNSHADSTSASSFSDSIVVETSNATSSVSDLGHTDSDSITLSNGRPLRSEPTEMADVNWKPGSLSEICHILNDSVKFSKKVLISDLNRSKSISVDFRLSRGISKVNQGEYENAVSIFNEILKDDPSSAEAFIGRGTTYAFQKKLDLAISDFTMAIEANSLTGEAWKRRGQARAAVGEYSEAIQDLTRALEFEPNVSDILQERGIINFKFKDYNAAIEDLSSCVSLDKNNKTAFTYLGLSLAAIGEYIRAEEAYLNAVHIDESFLEGWIHFAQFYQDLANSAKALHCLKQALHFDERFVKAYHLRGLLLHGLGQHRNAISDLSSALGIEGSNIECLYLRASCYHAIGEYRNAVKDYDSVLDLELDSMEKFVLQCMAFYQKEIALYTASRANTEFCWFNIDSDIDPLFKEYWCKKLHPKYVCERVFRQTSLSESLKKGRLRKQDFIITKQKHNLLQAADLIGQKVQNNCPGFLPNQRQHRMAGLAAIEIAQKVSKIWRSLQRPHHKQNGRKIRRKETNKPNLSGSRCHNRGGACSSSSTNSPESSISSNGFHEDRFISWQELYSIAVKWRQISEPCDPVLWVNKLSEESNSGFGPHVPLLVGQAKVVRYYPNYPRVLAILKAIMKNTEGVFNAEDKPVHLSEADLKKVECASSCSEIYGVVEESFWVPMPCESSVVEGKHLDGTRITLQKMDAKGFDFAIKAPYTAGRWNEYNTEMTVAWESICNAASGEAYGSTDLAALEPMRDAILRMAYYWYNLMPLSEGTAVVGHVVIIGLLLAANMEVAGNVPQGFQLDWEAILSSNPRTFLNSVKHWLYPSIKVNTSWKDFPDAESTFLTTGSVVAALSSSYT